MVEEASSPPLLAYGVSKRRVKRLRALVVTVVIVSVVALQFNWHRPVVEFGQRHYHAWRLPHAMRSAKDAAAANDRAALTAGG